jgi:hypothetical protein
LTNFGENVEAFYVPNSLPFEALYVRADGKFCKTENLSVGALTDQHSYRFFECPGEK